MSKRAGVWLMVIGGAVIGYGVFQSLVHETDIPESPVPRRPLPAPADPGTRQFAAIRAAEALADPMARCRGVPQPRGWHWPQATIEAFCTDSVIPRMEYDTVDSWVDDDKADKVDDRLEELTDAYFAGKLSEGVYWFNYTRNFSGSGAGLARLLSSWLRQSPDSAHAHTASALHHAAKAWGYRGGHYMNKVPQTDRDLIEKEIELATRAAQQAIKLDPRSLPAYKVLLTVARLGGDHRLADEAVRDGLAQRPDSYYLRAEMMAAAMPMWGGSQEELDAIAKDAQAHAATNPRLVALLATAGGYEGMMRWRDDDDRQAVRLYEAALAHGPDDMYLDQARRALANIGDRVRAVEVMSQLTRFDFGTSWVRVERAKELLRLKESEWALAEFEAMAAAGGADSVPFMHDYVWVLMQTGKYPDAESRLMTLLAANPSDRWANRVLAELYLYRMRKLDQAAVYIDVLLAADPDDGAALLLHTDLLQNRNAPQEEIRAAAEKFVQHADPDDEAQATALPKVRAWLTKGD